VCLRDVRGDAIWQQLREHGVTYGPFTVCQSQPQWADLPADQRAAMQARQGVGMISAEALRVVDDKMADVPADGGTMGEIVMRGNTVMVGYYLDPEATAGAFRGGWFHSGDLGVMYPDGYIELRCKAEAGPPSQAAERGRPSGGPAVVRRGCGL
jgi:acyl-CoA synthetase (AMP-forming)/AMP-acid ligase II